MWQDLPLFPESASTLAGRVDALYLAFVAVALFFSALIAFLILYLVIRYRRRAPKQVGELTYSVRLEVVWTVVPFVIVMVFFFWGAKVFFAAVRPPDGATQFYVVGKQWMWKLQHPEGQREINELHVPRGVPVKLTMTSEDVIHSFFVPAFRVKQDVLPGRYTSLWFEATKVGRFKLFCAEYCGAEHAQMMGHIVVMEPSAYGDWLMGRAPGASMAASGAELFNAHACDTCHRAEDSPRGPSLAGLVQDEGSLRESILDPGARLRPGYGVAMPTYRGLLSEEELLQLIEHIKSFQSPPEL